MHDLSWRKLSTTHLFGMRAVEGCKLQSARIVESIAKERIREPLSHG